MSPIDSARPELQKEYHIMEIWGFSHGRVGKVTDLRFKGAGSNPDFEKNRNKLTLKNALFLK
jgi:hypothetical protein